MGQSDSALEGYLRKMGLARYVPLFEQEELDMDSLVLLTARDFEELGVPRGPRLKIMAGTAAGHCTHMLPHNHRALQPLPLRTVPY